MRGHIYHTWLSDLQLGRTWSMGIGQLIHLNLNRHINIKTYLRRPRIEPRIFGIALRVTNQYAIQSSCIELIHMLNFYLVMFLHSLGIDCQKTKRWSRWTRQYDMGVGGFFAALMYLFVFFAVQYETIIMYLS